MVQAQARQGARSRSGPPAAAEDGGEAGRRPRALRGVNRPRRLRGAVQGSTRALKGGLFAYRTQDTFRLRFRFARSVQRGAAGTVRMEGSPSALGSKQGAARGAVAFGRHPAQAPPDPAPPGAQAASVRQACGAALLAFLLDYPLGGARLARHRGFLLANLGYEPPAAWRCWTCCRRAPAPALACGERARRCRSARRSCCARRGAGGSGQPAAAGAARPARRRCG